MAQVPLPRAGCFQADYPSQQWYEVGCVAAPQIPMVPKQGPRPLVVGNNNDLSARAPSGVISTAIGSFDSVTGVVTESGRISNEGPFVSNAYTLQINTEYMSSPVCAGTGDPADCRGWAQFVYFNDGSHGWVFIQYWIIRYNNTCPAGHGWRQFMFTDSSDIYCYQSSLNSAPIPSQPITNLAQLSLSGTARTTGNSVTLFIGGTASAMQTDADAVNAAASWTTAEFNVLGPGGDSTGGSQAVFNTGAQIQTRNRIIYGGSARPLCVGRGFTGETNNLGFHPSAPAMSLPGPALLFIEDTSGVDTADCSYGRTVGDTHLDTVMGLHYDFQASGDFVVADTDGFIVETRQESGAPTWPNAALNKAIATRMGKDTVAVCNTNPFRGPELFVNDQLIELGDGHVFSTPAGVDIWRIGNAYNVTDQSGNSVRATVNLSYIDLGIGLGQWPVKVSGLIANADGNVKEIATRAGKRFTAPFYFGAFYPEYGDSWRDLDNQSPLSVCGQVEPGNPAAPFYASDLAPELYEQARAVCLRAGVQGDELLDECTLDVAVIGYDSAANVFVDARQPVAVGYITNPKICAHGCPGTPGAGKQ
jgi:hypothetical protein